MKNSFFYVIMIMVIGMNIDLVKESLDKNTNLTEEFKENLFELILIFNKHYPEVELKLLTSRLETINFETVGKFVSDKVLTYNPKTNLLQINKTELSETNNLRHILMMAIIEMVSEELKEENEFLKDFKEGFIEIMANNLVGSEEDE
jgi:hypothetical protein